MGRRPGTLSQKALVSLTPKGRQELEKMGQELGGLSLAETLRFAAFVLLKMRPLSPLKADGGIIQLLDEWRRDDQFATSDDERAVAEVVRGLESKSDADLLALARDMGVPLVPDRLTASGYESRSAIINAIAMAGLKAMQASRAAQEKLDAGEGEA